MNQKEIQLKDLFIISTSRSVDKNKIKIEENAIYDFIGRTVVNNGVQGKINKLNFEPNNENCFSVIQIGQTWALWRENKWYASQNIFILEPKDKELKNHFLYFQAVINKKLGSLYGRDYNTYPTKEELNELTIFIPYDEGNNICFDYMDLLISELEQKRISELDKYLKTTGLNDYLLNNEDTKALNKKVLFKNFKVNELFDIHPTKTYKGNNPYLISKNGKIPVVANTSTNNGIGGYSNLMATEKGRIITFSDTTTADSIFYQPNNFIGYSHVQGMYPYSNLWNEKSLLYFMAIFKKVALSKNFDYANKFNRKLALEFVVMLPTIDGTSLDYDYMEKYVTAIEKLTIKNIVKYKDNIIAKTKGICKFK